MVIKSLTALSKYLGCYEQWSSTRKAYSLKWTTGNESLQAMERLFNISNDTDHEMSLEHMLKRVKEMMRILPKSMALVIRHALLTGLRPSEACESVRLLNDKDSSLLQERPDHYYYNPDRQMLQHYLYPDIFLRVTKKAYISYITLDNLQPIANLGPKTYMERDKANMQA